MNISSIHKPDRAAGHSLVSLNTVAVAAVTATIATSMLLSTDVAAQTVPPSRPQEVTVERSGPEAAQPARNYVTSDAAGLLIAVDRQTGQTRPLTADEAQKLVAGLKDMVSKSTEGLVEVRRANGAISMDLQGRFQSVMLARKEADGTVVQGCVDTLETASAFFDIDPALIGNTKRATARPARAPLETR